MAASDVPVWVQQVCALAGTGAVAIIAGWSERRKKHQPEAVASTAIIAGTLLGAQTFDGVIKAVEVLTRTVTAIGEQHHADTRKMIVAAEALEDELKRNTAAVGDGALMPRDIMRLIYDLKDK